MSSGFEQVTVIGQMSPSEVAAKLRQMGDNDVAAEIELEVESLEAARTFLGFGAERPWEYITHQIGFIPSNSAAGNRIPIKSIGDMQPNPALKDKRIDVILDRLYTYDYPGRGEHHVLITFEAINHLGGESEQATFNATFRARDQHMVSVVGKQIFRGLSVGKSGAGLKCFTTNVKNSSDEKFLELLETAPFKQGLNLLETAQPVLKPFTGMALGIATIVGKRNRNVPVQQIDLGLDFDTAATGVRLDLGTYVAVQVPRIGEINWNEWEFDRSLAAIAKKNDPGTVTLPYNYLAFRVVLRDEAKPQGA